MGALTAMYGTDFRSQRYVCTTLQRLHDGIAQLPCPTSTDSSYSVRRNDGQTYPFAVQASLEASEKLFKKVKQAAPAVSAGVSNLLTQEDLSWSKLRPKFTGEKQQQKADDLGSQAAILAEKEAALAIPREVLVTSKDGLLWDQLLLPGLAVMLLSLLAGYQLGQHNVAAEPMSQGISTALLVRCDHVLLHDSASVASG